MIKSVHGLDWKVFTIQYKLWGWEVQAGMSNYTPCSRTKRSSRMINGIAEPGSMGRGQRKRIMGQL